MAEIKLFFLLKLTSELTYFLPSLACLIHTDLVIQKDFLGLNWVSVESAARERETSHCVVTMVPGSAGREGAQRSVRGTHCSGGPAQGEALKKKNYQS